MSNSTYFETYAARLLCNYIQSIPTIFLWIELLFGGFYRLSVEVKRAVGQGGGRGCTLLYSLRLWPERLQAVAPGCSHFAPATWIHRQPDPWLTLQVVLSNHPLQYSTIASCLHCLLCSTQISTRGFDAVCSSLKNDNNASNCMPCSVLFPPCRRPVFSCLTFPLLLRIAVYIDYVSLNMPAK